jgi:hypothetical protein
MSDTKHLNVLTELFAHKDSVIHVTDALNALSLICSVDSESPKQSQLSRNGKSLNLTYAENDNLNSQQIVAIRQFLKLSASGSTNISLQDAMLVIDHHRAILIAAPTDTSQTQTVFHAKSDEGQKLHHHPTTPPFNDHNPVEDAQFYSQIIASLSSFKRIVLASHGQGSSRASDHLLALLDKKHSVLTQHIVAVLDCDVEALSDNALAALGASYLV